MARRRRRIPDAWILLLAGLGLLAGAVADVGYYAVLQPAPPASAVNAQYPLPAVTGVLQLHDPIYGMSSVAQLGGPCRGLGRNDGLLGGTPIVVEDPTGALIATGALDVGRVAGGSTCQFGFVVQGVPKADAYQFRVAGRSLGTYRYDDLVAGGWQVALSLG